MPGGGIHWLAPGQITDDGELTLSLLNALAYNGFNLEHIASNYVAWFLSKPFDVGGTCRKTIGYVTTYQGRLETKTCGSLAKAMQDSAMKLIHLSPGNL